MLEPRAREEREGVRAAPGPREPARGAGPGAAGTARGEPGPLHRAPEEGRRRSMPGPRGASEGDGAQPRAGVAGL